MAIEERDTSAVVAAACPYCDAPLPEQTSLAIHLERDCPATSGDEPGVRYERHPALREHSRRRWMGTHW
ncbi:hypothetical protein [Haloarcula litorea]|uniref:hypothetical protein n=1 Tax=Haloarcula litorea TaxID=3032579 RepID=UPI0023E83194|nr:hypothetical protein [Halomicroarcula sp. GDY20]